MAAELVTPVDEFSGIPLPIDPRYMTDRPSRFKPDWHHAWHERRDPLLRNSLGGLALRHSRIQFCNYDAHHLDYHGRIVGPQLPDNDAERIRPMLLAAAGYIPEHALQFQGESRNPRRHSMSKKMRKQLWSSGLVKVEHPSVIRNFMTNLTLSQDLVGVSESAIDEFLNTGDEVRRWELGNDFLGRATRQLVEPVRLEYQTAFKEELIPHTRAHHAAGFVLASMGFKRNRGNLYSQLRQRLAA